MYETLELKKLPDQNKFINDLAIYDYTMHRNVPLYQLAKLAYFYKACQKNYRENIYLKKPKLYNNIDFKNITIEFFLKLVTKSFENSSGQDDDSSDN